MEYAKLTMPVRTALISMEPTNWGAPYQKLFEQTDESGWEEWLLYSDNNFNNPFQKADEKRYKQKGWWAVIFRDIVREGGKGEKNGRLNLYYISHAGTEWEKKHNVWSPKSGFYVPTNDGIFHEGTLIPFETVQDKKEAVERLEAKSIPKEQVSYFYRLDKYDGDRFVGRDFGPCWGVDCRFGVDAGWLPSYSGDGRVASRPAHREPEIVMEAKAMKKAK